MNVSRSSAETWAEWFRCLGDPSRILILNVLTTARRPMTVGEIVDQLDIGQSTVSHHLSLLEETCFVFVERQGTASYFRINDACLECFPSTAEVIMGRVPRGRSNEPVPWARQRPTQESKTSRRRKQAGSAQRSAM